MAPTNGFSVIAGADSVRATVPPPKPGGFPSAIAVHGCTTTGHITPPAGCPDAPRGGGHTSKRAAVMICSATAPSFCFFSIASERSAV